MRALKWIAIALVVYGGIVAAFESSIGYLQPKSEDTIVITTFEDGEPHDRVVSGLRSEDKLYAAANHWPRAWYRRALANPDVEVTVRGQKGKYRAVAVSGEEQERVDREHHLPAIFRILTGFPPRYFVRLDPR
jgi:hypothetical protein